MRHSSTIVAIFICAAVLTGCMEPMEDISQITKLRIMAVKAEPPEIAPGQGTTLEVLFADPAGANRKVTILWLNCIGNLSQESDRSKECTPIWPPQVDTVENGGDIYNIKTTPPDLLDKLPDKEKSLDVTVIAVICAGGDIKVPKKISPGNAISSLDELCTDGDGAVSTKKLIISASKTPNQNPKIEKLVFGHSDECFDLSPEQADKIGNDDSPIIGSYECEDVHGCRQGADVQAYVTKASFEVYKKNVFGQKTDVIENPYISWFIAGVDPPGPTGRFQGDRSRTVVPTDPKQLSDWTPGSFDVTWVPPRNGGLFKLWVVVNDMRGGIEWKSYFVEAIVPSN